MEVPPFFSWFLTFVYQYPYLRITWLLLLASIGIYCWLLKINKRPNIENTIFPCFLGIQTLLIIIFFSSNIPWKCSSAYMFICITPNSFCIAWKKSSHAAVLFPISNQLTAYCLLELINDTITGSYQRDVIASIPMSILASFPWIV